MFPLHIKSSPNGSGVDKTNGQDRSNSAVGINQSLNGSVNSSCNLDTVQVNKSSNEPSNKSATIPNANVSQTEKEKPKKKSKLSFLSRKKNKEQSSPQISQ